MRKIIIPIIILIMAFSTQSYAQTIKRKDVFKENASYIYAQAMNKNVGIGTSVPAFKLDVKGTINATSFYVNGSPFASGGSGIGVADANDISTYATSTTITGYNNFTWDGSNLILNTSGVFQALNLSNFQTPGINDTMASSGDIQLGDVDNFFDNTNLDINSNLGTVTFNNDFNGLFMDSGQINSDGSGDFFANNLQANNTLFTSSIQPLAGNYTISTTIGTNSGSYYKWGIDLIGSNDNAGPSSFVRFGKDASSGSYAGGSRIIQFTNVGDHTEWFSMNIDSGGDLAWDLHGKYVIFGSSPSGTFNETMRLTNAGNLGIGYSTPNALLAVNGNVGIGTSVASSRLIVIGGNVGIGTLAPGQLLDVKGTTRAINFIGAGTGLTGTAPSLTAGTVTTNANLTGDVTSSGNLTTFATVNSNVGSFTSANITVNAKGLITAAANGSGSNYWSLNGGVGNVGISTTNTVGIGTTMAAAGAGLVVMNGNVGIGTWTPAFGLDMKNNTFSGRDVLRVSSVAQSATPSINTDNMDVAEITGLAQAITSMTTNLTGTPRDKDMIEIEITDNGTTRAITWGASFSSTSITIPSTTVISTPIKIFLQWSSSSSVWQCVGIA